MGVFQNNLLAGAAAAASAGGAGFYSYQIEQSVRFEKASNSRLTRTFGTPSSQTAFTISFWFKRWGLYAEASAAEQIMSRSGGFQAGTGGALVFDSTIQDSLNFYSLGSTGANQRTTQVFRDVSGWGHLVARVDSGQSSGDRIRFYLNGSEITDFNATNEPSGNISSFNDASAHHIGGNPSGGDSNMYLAEFIFTDGQSYAPTQFGETKNGVWIPKDPSGTTFGNNGFHLKFENASDLGNDSSGNNNDFTATNMGTDHQVLDSPTFGS
jgi:hypothetical protein